MLKEKAVRLQYIQAVKMSLSEAHGDQLDVSGLRALENAAQHSQVAANNVGETLKEETIRSINVAEQQNQSAAAASSPSSAVDATNYAP